MDGEAEEAGRYLSGSKWNYLPGNKSWKLLYQGKDV